MAHKTKLVKIHLEDSFSKCIEKRILELKYPVYCELKNRFHNGNSKFTEKKQGIIFNWKITKIENI